jgi:putative ABC transport system permease protein
MTTLALPPPPPVSPVSPSRGGANGGLPARRAVRRWAWRMLRREWRQQLVILALLVVAVAATTVGLGMVVNVEHTNKGYFGNADTRIDISNPGATTADLDAARKRFGAVEAIVESTIPVPGSVTPINLRAQDPHGRFGSPMLRLVSGHLPTGASQVAVTAGVASLLDLKTGSTVEADGRTLTVVGRVENPDDLTDAFALIAPGELRAPTSLTLLLNTGNALAAARFTPPAGTIGGVSSTSVSGPADRKNHALAVLLIATIGLMFIGLLAVAGFTVLAQRRLRSLGMMAAIGASDRHVRRVLLANGAAVGVVGASVGTALGVLTWFSLGSVFSTIVGHRIDPFSLPWWAVIAGAVLALITAVIASWWPARAVAKVPIVVALSGRPTPPQPVHRFALIGVVVAAVGFLLLVLSHHNNAAYIISGTLATTIGTLLLAPLAVRLLAGVARRAPVAIRLALRDLARYQARSGAAVAAGTLAVGIAATITIHAAASQHADHSADVGNLPTNQVVVWLDGNPNDQGGPGLSVASPASASTKPSAPSAATVASAQRTVDAISTALNAHRSVEFEAAIDLNQSIPAGAEQANDYSNLARPISSQGRKGFELITTPLIVTTPVLEFYRIPASTVAAGADVVTSRTSLGKVDVNTGPFGDFAAAKVQVSAALPKYGSAPNTVLTQHALTKFGLTAVPAGWLIETPHPLTKAQIADARGRAAAAGITIETRNAPNDTMQQLREYSTTIGILIALGVLAMTVGLIRSETAGDLRTLTAAGASGRTRRTLTAATAGSLAVLSGVLGTASAYLALIAWNWHDVSYLDSPPYPELAALLIALPAVAFIGGWVAGRTPRSIGRPPVD